MSERLRIFDTTLRDGEQSPGFSMTMSEKLTFARQLKKLGVDAIEAGFPNSSLGDFQSVEAIAKEAGDSSWPIICGLARCHREDILRCHEAVRPAARPRIHVFIATSAIHMEKKLKKTPAEVLALTHEYVAYARSLCDDIEFSAEDAARSDREFLAEVVRTAIDAGATTINIPDTVGYTVPDEFGALIHFLFERVPNIKQAIISVHCHNDLGLATANTLAAVKCGARQAEVTVNGIGERAGNAALEEVVMALKTRRDFYSQYDIGVVTTQIGPASRLLTHLTGIKVQPNKPYVGANAFAHEAGIHQHGVIQDPRTYEINTPESVGWQGESIIIGKHSGRNGVVESLKRLGYDTLRDLQIDDIYSRLKALADQKKTIYDEDVMAVADEVTATERKDAFELVDIMVMTGTKIQPTAIVSLRINGEIKEATGHGGGPVEASFNAIEQLVAPIVGGDNMVLEVYDLSNTTKGADAMAQTMVQVRHGEIVVKGRYYHTDVITASDGAFLQALNRLYRRLKNGNGKTA